MEPRLNKVISKAPEQKVLKKNRPSFPDSWEPSKGVTGDSVVSNKAIDDSGKAIEESRAVDGYKASDRAPDLIDSFLEQEIAISDYNKRSESLRMFIQALSEVSPLISFVSRESIDVSGADFKKRISDLFQAQIGIVSLVISNIGISSEYNKNKVIMPILAKKISELIGSGIVSSDDDRESMLIIMSLLDTFISDRPYISDVIENNFLSNDILVNVKLALFPASLRFSRLLSNLNIVGELQTEWLRWHHDATVCLAKDLAFNWDKTSSFKDREKLFESSLSHCAVLVESTWKEEICSSIDKMLTHVSFEAFNEHLGDFEKQVYVQHMGHFESDDEDADMLALKQKLYGYFLILGDRYSSLSIFELDPVVIRRYLGYVVATSSGHCWKEACNQIADMVSSLSEEEYKNWSENEGQNPLNLASFYDLIQGSVDEAFLFIERMGRDDLLTKCKSKMAVLWGLSDAICKIKRR